jgi:hypothetical protein
MPQALRRAYRSPGGVGCSVGEELNFGPLLIALLGAGVGIVGGYLVGVAQSRNERRDNALAEIYKEMTLFYGRLLSWTDDPLPLTLINPALNHRVSL